MVDGLLLINKSSGGTSHDLVDSMRKILSQKTIGHGGTLDPMAEGLMLILLGRATKLSDYLLKNDKCYRFVIQFGVRTDTLDRTGKILNQQKVNLKQEVIEKHLIKNQGLLSLPVPLFSAVKMKGKKLYQYTRENQTIVPPLREMYFYKLHIIEIQADRAEVEISCRKGSYIRSWVSYIGEELGTGACLENLIRLESKPFSLKSALSLDEVKLRLKNVDTFTSQNLLKNLAPAFITFSKALPHIPFVIASEQDERQLKYGVLSKALLFRLDENQKQVNKKREIQIIQVMSYRDNQLLALLSLGIFKAPCILRVFSSYQGKNREA